MGKDFERSLRETVEHLAIAKRKAEEGERVRLRELEKRKERERVKRNAQIAERRRMVDRGDEQERRKFEVLDALQVNELLCAANDVLYGGRGEVLPGQGRNTELRQHGGWSGGYGGFNRGSGAGPVKDDNQFSGYILIAETNGRVRGQIFAGFVGYQPLGSVEFMVVNPAGWADDSATQEKYPVVKYLDGTWMSSSTMPVEAVTRAINDRSEYGRAKRHVEAAIAAMVLVKIEDEQGDT